MKCTQKRLNTNEKIYINGLNRLEKEFNIVRIMKVLRKVELLEDII